MYRDLIYVDIARAILTSLYDLTGLNMRSRLKSDLRFKGELGLLTDFLE